jgi:hypothetical protein
MQLRRVALALGALTLSVAPLTACSGWASERDYTPAAGANNRDGDVDVLGAVIVSGTAGEGVFIASLVNNDPEESVQLTGLSGTGSGSGLEFGAVNEEVPARGLTNLAESGGIEVTGDFEAGQYKEVTVDFSTGESVTVDVPVLPPTGEFEGLGG